MCTHALKYKCTFGVQWEKKRLVAITKDVPVFEQGRNNEAKNIPDLQTNQDVIKTTTERCASFVTDNDGRTHFMHDS